MNSKNVDPRMIFSAERTMLAWIRTGLAMMALGFVVARFSLLLQEFMRSGMQSEVSSSGYSLWVGVILIVLGVAVLITSGINYNKHIKRLSLNQGIEVREWSLARVTSFILALIGIIMTVYLISIPLR